MFLAACRRCTSRKTRVVVPDMFGLTCRLGAHISCYAHDTRLYPMYMELHRRKWGMIVQGVKGPPNEEENATRKSIIEFATNCLQIENASNLQFVACHRLNNKADAATLIIFVDLADRNRWFYHAQNLKNQKKSVLIQTFHH